MTSTRSRLAEAFAEWDARQSGAPQQVDERDQVADEEGAAHGPEQAANRRERRREQCEVVNHRDERSWFNRPVDRIARGVFAPGRPGG